MSSRIRRVLKRLGLGLAALLLLLAALITWRVLVAWPKTSGRLAVTGLQATVEVIRDRWGVPHLYAANEHDLFFAQGYVQAQDRLWQMEFNRHVGAGALSALFGAATLPADRALRTFGIRRAAEGDWKVTKPETRRILEAYAQGVNAFFATHRRSLPVEYTILGVRPALWTPVDSLAWGKMVAFSLGQNHIQELLRYRLAAAVGAATAARLMPPTPDSERPIVAPEEAGSAPPAGAAAGAAHRSALAWLADLGLGPGLTRGSNAWAVHGSRTASGLPLLANDTHLELSQPSPWYENGLHGGRYDVVGFSLPGVPLVLIGHNGRAAWGISNLRGDVQDLFVETLDGRGHYRDQGEWKPLRVVRETIPVKGGRPRALDVPWTARGPIVNEIEGLPASPALALRWTAHDPGHSLDALARLDRARDWTSFRAALALWGAPPLNFVYADVDGNIGYQAAGQIPIRAAGQQGMVPVPAEEGGAGGGRDWQGLVPFAGMPSLFNPPEGFLVTANNKVVASRYPYSMGHDFADPYRAARIRERLAALPKATVEDMKALQREVRSPAAEALRPYLLALRPKSALEREALGEVARWDLRFTPESAGATIYYAWYLHLLPDIVGDELGAERMEEYLPFAIGQTPMFTALMASPDDPWFDDTTTKGKVETRDDVVRKAFQEGLALLARRLGGRPANWTWGRLHTAALLHHPFGSRAPAPLRALVNGRPLPLPGEAFTVDAMAPTPGDPFRVFFGVSQRLIVDLGDLSRAPAVNSTGESGLLLHPHGRDQTSLWARGDYRPMLFTRKAVEAEAEGRLRLEPGAP